MNKRYSIDEKIKIGQETFYRLIETEYGENVKEEMMKKYGIDATKLSTFLNMFKRHIVEPKPTEEENSNDSKLCQRWIISITDKAARAQRRITHSPNIIQIVFII